MCKKGIDTMSRPLSDYRCRCGCGLVNISEELVEIDNKVIEKVGFKPDIASACRCLKHDARIQFERKHKGLTVAIDSSHKCDDKDEKCEALDYSIPSSWRRAVILEALVKLEIRRIGIGKDFIHFDIDKKKPFPLIWVY